MPCNLTYKAVARRLRKPRIMVAMRVIECFTRFCRCNALIQLLSTNGVGSRLWCASVELGSQRDEFCASCLNVLLRCQRTRFALPLFLLRSACSLFGLLQTLLQIRKLLQVEKAWDCALWLFQRLRLKLTSCLAHLTTQHAIKK